MSFPDLSPLPLFALSPLPPLRPFPSSPLYPFPYVLGKYLRIVAAFGFAVASENTIISSAEMSTIGTTGMKPNTAVPPGVRVNTSTPPGAQETIDGPGAGAGTRC